MKHAFNFKDDKSFADSAACCVYAIDNQDIEENVENRMDDFVGDDRKKQTDAENVQEMMII